MADKHIPSIRISPDRNTVGQKLGFSAEMHGTWEGQGFNLIARPDKQGGSPLFLELNQTFETLSFTPIASSIPNRGSAVDDIELFGLTYLQKVSDSVTGGACTSNRESGCTSRRRIRMVEKPRAWPGWPTSRTGTRCSPRDRHSHRPVPGQPFRSTRSVWQRIRPRSSWVIRSRPGNAWHFAPTTSRFSLPPPSTSGRPPGTHRPYPCRRRFWASRCRK